MLAAPAPSTAWPRPARPPQRYKQSMSGILGAAKASTGPLWRAQRRMNKYRALEEHEAAREEVEESGNEGEEATLAGGSKKGRKGAAAAGGAHKRGGKAAGRGEKAAARKRLVGSDDSSSEEEGEEEDARAAADAVAAMQKLLLATAKKVGQRVRRPGRPACLHGQLLPSRCCQALVWDHAGSALLSRRAASRQRLLPAAAGRPQPRARLRRPGRRSRP